MSEQKIYTVSEINLRIKGLLESEYPLVWIEGEISNLRTPSSGHLYFVLKDAKAQIRAVMFRHQNQLLRFNPEDGMAVLALGRITVYEPRGEYQVIIERLEPKGRGALQLAFEQLLEKLGKEGLFEQSEKKPIPFLPDRVVVVTSPTGAAVRDFIHVMDRRFGSVHILVFPVRVQGREAAGEIAAALDRINAEIDADVIVLTRGGGSIEDLWPFNEEQVARAVHRSRIPVVSAVGHEVDFTISDFAADRRAPTPSVAAEILFPSKADLLNTVQSHLKQCVGALTSKLALGKERLGNLEARLSDPRRRIADGLLKVDDFRDRLQFHWLMTDNGAKRTLDSLENRLLTFRPRERFALLGQRLDHLRTDLIRLQTRSLERSSERLQTAVQRMNAVNPLNVLDRGYSIATRIPDGRVLRDSSEIASGEQVHVRLRKGGLVCKVEEVE